MYAKMYLVTPMVYEKLKRCLDKSDVSSLDRVNRPFFTNNQKQIFNQQPPQPPNNPPYRESFFREGPPFIPPATSEQKLDDIVQKEMSKTIREQQESEVPEFEEVQDPFIDDSFEMDYNQIDWDRPIPISTGTQTDRPLHVSQETQTDRPLHVSQETQTEQPLHVTQETQTSMPLYVDQETQTRQPLHVEQEIQTEPETALVPVQSVVPYSEEPMEFTPSDQMSQIRFRPNPLQPSVTYERRKRLTHVKPKEKKQKPNLSRSMVRSNLPIRRRDYQDIENEPHAEHFGQVLRQYARPRRQQPAISEVVFSGREIPPIELQQPQLELQQPPQPLQLTYQQGQLPDPRQLEQSRGPFVLPQLTLPMPLTQRQRQIPVPRRSEQFRGPFALPQLALPMPVNQQQQLQPYQTFQPTPSTSGQLIYRARPQSVNPVQTPPLTFERQRKRVLEDPDYVSPDKIIKNVYQGPIPNIVITPPDDEVRVTRGSKRPLQSVERPSKVAKVKNFQCDVCGLMLSTKYSLDRHKERESRRLQAVEAEDPTNKSDFARWLETKKTAEKEKESEVVDPQPGSKRSASTAKLSSVRKTKRRTPANDFPSWALRRPEPL